MCRALGLSRSGHHSFAPAGRRGARSGSSSSTCWWRQSSPSSKPGMGPRASRRSCDGAATARAGSGWRPRWCARGLLHGRNVAGGPQRTRATTSPSLPTACARLLGSRAGSRLGGRHDVPARSTSTCRQIEADHRQVLQRPTAQLRAAHLAPAVKRDLRNVQKCGETRAVELPIAKATRPLEDFWRVRLLSPGEVPGPLAGGSGGVAREVLRARGTRLLGGSPAPTPTPRR